MQVAAKTEYHETAIDLHEFAIHAADGSPEGCEFAESYEEACSVWGMDMLPGATRLMQVFCGAESRWFRIERLSDGVDARECAE